MHTPTHTHAHKPKQLDCLDGNRIVGVHGVCRSGYKTRIYVLLYTHELLYTRVQTSETAY
jgi:hypothetical protein